MEKTIKMINIDKKPTPSELHENAYRTSVKSEGIAKDTKKSNKVRSNFRKGFAVLAAAALIAGSVATTIFVENIQDNIAVNEYYSSEQYYDSIENCKWGQVIDGDYVYGYNQSKLAEWATNQENPDLALFSIYKKIDQNVIWNMNEVISKMGTYGETNESYDDFADYLIKKGFVDEEGNPSADEYKRIMTERVLAESTIKNTTDNYGIK